MSEKRRHPAQTRENSGSTSAIVRQLAEPQRLSHQSTHATRIVMAIRLIAVCANKRHDPVGELTCRLGSVPAARAVLEFADYAGKCWPGNVQVFRPCCWGVSPDESVLVAMADAAIAGDRTAFSCALDGFIRADRHERLYEHAMEAVAHLP